MGILPCLKRERKGGKERATICTCPFSPSPLAAPALPPAPVPVMICSLRNNSRSPALGSGGREGAEVTQKTLPTTISHTKREGERRKETPPLSVCRECESFTRHPNGFLGLTLKDLSVTSDHSGEDNRSLGGASDSALGRSPHHICPGKKARSFH